MVALHALSFSALLWGVAAAQAQQTPVDKPAPDESIVLSQVVVTGVRASLITAQELKQNAPEFVDSIVAQDIGKLPDNTVADALQRVAGVQVSRGAGEASAVVIRGLPNIETTLNGYEVFTGTSRFVSLQDIPAEMLAGVDVYKTVGPDKIEGGVAGLIDVRLRRPFDFKEGLTYSLNLRGIHGDQADKTSYNAGFLVSNHWKNAAGEFGALVDVSYSHRQYEDQVVDNYVHFGEPFDLATDASGKSGYFADNFGLQIVPGKRTRPAASVMLQWRTNSGLELHWDNLFTGYRNDHTVDFFIGIPSWGGFRDNVTLYPEQFDGRNFVKSFVAHDTNTLTSKQAYHDTTDTYQGAFGATWDRDRIKLTGELSYNFSTFKTRSVILDTNINSPVLDITYNDGDAPTIKASGTDYADGNNYHLATLFDQWTRAHTAQYAARTDLLYRLGNSFVKSLQFGGRYSERDVNYHSANNGGMGIIGSVAASSLPGLGRVTTSETFVSGDQINIRKWWSADENFLLNETDQLRPLAGQKTGMPDADISRVFKDNEKTFAVYALANYTASLGGLPLDGVVGARFVDTHQSLMGFQRELLNGGTSGDYVPAIVDQARWDVLPTLNGRLKLTDELFFRASMTKTVTRPNFSDLNPAISVTAPGPTMPGLGSGGNPDLAPIDSTNYDVSLEYYFSKSSLVSVAGFYRSIDGYIQSYQTEEVINGGNYSITRPRSTNNGYLQGIETSYQQFFDFLPDAFKGLGLQANYTYIKGETENPLTNLKEPIGQVSKSNYNIILIYERGAFSSRLAYNWRGKYIDSFNQPGVQPGTVWVQPRGQLDFSASYAIGKNLTITLDATNLTRSKYHDNFGDMTMFSRDVRNYDRTIELGLRYRY
jgi:TonB-dependent receptor